MKLQSKRLAILKPLPLLMPLLLMAPVYALQFDVGPVEVGLDSQFSLGTSWRVERQDSALLDFDGDGIESTSDDGNRNYNKGDAFSQIFKGSHDLQLSYENYGAFLRGKYWYDAAIDNNSVNYGHGPTVVPTNVYSGITYTNNVKLDDSNFNDLSKASGATVLDAFIYGEFEVIDMPLDIRLGRQVVSWGESTFIGGGVNAINPVDASSFRRPGAEIKEGLLPVNMAYGNLGIAGSLSLEAFYQLEFQETVSDPCGTYFSTSDIAADGCTVLAVSGGALSISRNQDGSRKPSADGQFGFALRYFSDEWDTEFALYMMNIHSRLPLYNTTVDTNDDAAVLGALQAQATTAVTQGYVDNVGQGVVDSGAVDDLIAADITTAVAASAPALISATRSLTAGYFFDYPEDIQLLGLSFSSNFAGVAISGEVSHKMDSPVQINGTLATGVNLGNGVGATNAGQTAAYSEYYSGASKGEDIKGYRVFDITQAQVTLINLWNQVAGASVISLVAEAGVSFIHDFDDVLRYGRSSIYGAPAFDGTDDGFVTESSWGYRTRMAAKYENVFSGIGITPVLSWSQDVDGYAASPGGAFVEGAKTLGLSIEASYLQTYRATFAYKQFMGGDYNVLSDRDFASISLDVQF